MISSEAYDKMNCEVLLFFALNNLKSYNHRNEKESMRILNYKIKQNKFVNIRLCCSRYATVSKKSGKENHNYYFTIVNRSK